MNAPLHGFVRAVGVAAFLLVSPSWAGTDVIKELPEWKGKAVREMIERFGRATDESSYTVLQAPRKCWNHRILFSVYPRGKSDNGDVLIKEYVWDDGDFEIRACCHRVEGGKEPAVWRVIGAMRIHKDVRF